jgi:glutathione S-transferase
MILIGQYDSPFVRRVAVALREYRLPYEHRPWSVWAQSEEVAKFTPLRRVPVLVLDDGETLVESAAILDALDDLVGAEPALLETPAYPALRAHAARCEAMASFAAVVQALHVDV